VVAEDDLGLAVAQSVVDACARRLQVVRRVVTRGFGNIRRDLDKFRRASMTLPHVVLTDLDRMACPALLREEWGIVQLPAELLLCIAVRETESWLLGDRSGMARFAAVGMSHVPRDPESLPDPKAALVSLARRSRKRALVEELVPQLGSRLPVGPLYVERLAEFARETWNVDAASAACPSLRRMRERLESLPG
jgi:hypothetical protein